MKVMLVFKSLKNYYKRDRKDFILSILFLITLVVFMYSLMWLSAIVEGRC
jgi:hypothetical protein